MIGFTGGCSLTEKTLLGELTTMGSYYLHNVNGDKEGCDGGDDADEEHERDVDVEPVWENRQCNAKLINAMEGVRHPSKDHKESTQHPTRHH